MDTLVQNANPKLQLTPTQFAAIEPNAYILSQLSQRPTSNGVPTRANAREQFEFRDMTVTVGGFTHANGSSTVRIGDTSVVCGIVAEQIYTSEVPSWDVSQASVSANKRRRLASSGKTLLDNDEETDQAYENEDIRHIEDRCLLVPNVTMNTGCTPGYVPGAPPSEDEQTISNNLLGLLRSTRMIQAEDLRIWYQPPNLDAGESDSSNETQLPELKAFWVLHIDIMVMSYGGNIFDAAWTALVAALRHVTIPYAWWDVDKEIVLCSDDASKAHKLSLREMPTSCMFSIFEPQPCPASQDDVTRGSLGEGWWIFADPDGYEESVCEENVWCVVSKDKNGKTRVYRAQNVGGSTVDSEIMHNLLQISAKKWEDMKNIIDEVVATGSPRAVAWKGKSYSA
ncbi:3' exoribonuclease family protein [Penicillium malachiteum]|nr:3' exoribonuclease family protein [Penicillium malachiteum]